MSSLKTGEKVERTFKFVRPLAPYDLTAVNTVLRKEVLKRWGWFGVATVISLIILTVNTMLDSNQFVTMVGSVPAIFTVLHLLDFFDFRNKIVKQEDNLLRYRTESVAYESFDNVNEWFNEIELEGFNHPYKHSEDRDSETWGEVDRLLFAENLAQSYVLLSQKNILTSCGYAYRAYFQDENGNYVGTGMFSVLDFTVLNMDEFTVTVTKAKYYV
jgi:hypothetical protein